MRERGGRPGVWPPKPATTTAVSTDPGAPKPAIPERVSTDPRPPAPPGRAPSASACEPYRALIVEALGRGRNAMAIWQDLVDDHGFAARYASVRRFVLALRGRTPAEARVVITTSPGEEGQVDYGDGPMVRDRSTGKYRRTRLFVLTLGYSRKSVRLLVCALVPAPGFLDSGLKVITSTLPRPARRNRVALGLDSDSRTSPASTARCTSVETRARRG